MLMSIFSNRTLLILTMMLLTACGSTPEPMPAPEPQQEPVAVTDSAAEVTSADGEAAVEPAPEPVDFYQQFYDEALDALKQGETEEAVVLLQQVSTDAPDKPYIFTNLGLAYFKLEKLEQAEEAFQEAIFRSKNDAVAYNHLGILQRYKGQFEEARQQYQRAIRIDSDYASAHLNLGILFDLYLQDLELALQHYQKYQTLVSEEDDQVAKWITDIQRRLKTAT